MINDWLPPEEQDALQAILRHHGVDNPVLTKHLAQLGNWIRLHEQSKFAHSHTPPYLMVLLSMMGIYGGEVLDQPREQTS